MEVQTVRVQLLSNTPPGVDKRTEVGEKKKAKKKNGIAGRHIRATIEVRENLGCDYV